MTHPYAKAWDQPALSEIKIDSNFAYMTKESFNKLADYSRSCPSAVYEGKMWKASDNKSEWYLHWWGYSEDPDKCSGNVRQIVIVDGKSWTSAEFFQYH